MNSANLQFVADYILGMKLIIGIGIMIVVAGVAIGLGVGFGLYYKSQNHELFNITTTPGSTIPSTNSSPISTTITTSSSVSTTITTTSPFANVTICDKIGRCNVCTVTSVSDIICRYSISTVF